MENFQKINHFLSTRHFLTKFMQHGLVPLNLIYDDGQAFTIA